MKTGSVSRRKFHLLHYSLYSSTSCCISHGPSQKEMAIFDAPTAPRPLNRFSWNLKYMTTSQTRPRMQTFWGLRRCGWSGQIASMTHESLSFFCLFATPTSLDTPHAQYVITPYTSFCPRKFLAGVRKMIFEIWPPLHPKNVKIGTLSWRSM